MTTNHDKSPPADAVLAALARLHAFPEFAHSPRLTSFLDHIVAETLAGRAAELRAYSIATTVFERDKSFDAHNNSIVRVEATRLRKALRNYYDGPGAADPVVIDVPLGGYTPRFTQIAAPPAALTPLLTASRAPPIEPAVVAKRSPARPRSFAIAGSALAMLAATVFVFASHFLGSAVHVPPRAALDAQSPVGETASRSMPLLAIYPVQVIGDDHEAFATAGQLQHDLADALGRFDEINVLRSFLRSVQNAGPQKPDYELHGHIDALTNGHLEATFRLFHSDDRRLVWSGVFNLPASGFDAAARAALVRTIVTPVAQPFGALISDLRTRVEAGLPTPKSIECIARFEDFWDTRAEAKRRAAYDCLTAAIALHPQTSAFQVALSNLHVAEYLGDLPKLGPLPSLDAAEQAAERAIRMAPGRAHPYLALSQVLNLRGNYDKALRLAERALEMNPNDTDITAQLGALYVLRGQLEKGSRLLHQALEHNPAYPAWMQFYLFLEAYLRGDQAGQQAAARSIGATEEPDAALAQVIAAAEAGKLDDAKTALAQLRAHYPAFAASPKAALERLTLAPEIVERLMLSASKIGL